MSELTRNERLGLSEDGQIIYALNCKVEHLEARLKEAEADTRRLDWFFERSRNCGPYPLNIYPCVGYWALVIEGNSYTGDTPRQAIDLAMSKEKS